MFSFHDGGERKVWNRQKATRLLLIVVFFALVFLVPPACANVASRFSIAAGEVYSDNIFFSQDKESDFVTLLSPTFSLAYKPSGYPKPTLNVNITAPVEIFAHHSDLNNMGDNIGLNASYFHPYSPRLDFTFTDRFLRRGESRTGGFGDRGEGGGLGGLGGGRGGSGLGSITDLDRGGFEGFGGGGSCGRSNVSGRRGNTALESGDLVVRGERLENQIGGNANFRYSANLSFTGSYCWDSIWFLSGRGKETAHSFSLEGTYRLWRQHTLSAGYTINLLRSRNGQDDIVHDFDFGGDFLGGLLEEIIPLQREVRVTPTLSVRASTGIAVRTSGSGDSKFGLEHKLDLEVAKVWRTASLRFGVHRGLTGSYGVSGPSFTTEFFSFYSLQLSRRLTGFAGSELALFDAEEADFTTFQAMLGLRYWLTEWLSANMAYSYSWTDSENGTAAREALGRGKVASNTLFFFFAMHFDVWPHFGLAREGLGSFMGPALRSPSRRSSHHPLS